MSHLRNLCSRCPASMEMEIDVTHSDLALAESWITPDTSSGYLEDAIAGSGKGILCKQQESPSCSQDQKKIHYMDDQVHLFPTSSSTTAQPLHEGHWKKIAYPFELVKPGGVEGETTLEDINHHILMSPSKPIAHPVGDSVTHHPCISARGFGISGKSVTALTRIQTQGKGSITIIRTKG